MHFFTMLDNSYHPLLNNPVESILAISESNPEKIFTLYFNLGIANLNYPPDIKHSYPRLVVKNKAIIEEHSNLASFLPNDDSYRYLVCSIVFEDITTD